tara:strand:+ start:723 stop:926 length:204 start_codon:yes stop_codon:yes gene_type:complete
MTTYYDSCVCADCTELSRAFKDLLEERDALREERDALKAELDSLPDLAHARGLAMDLVDALELGGSS